MDLATDEPPIHLPDSLFGGFAPDSRSFATTEQGRTLSIRTVPRPSSP